MKAVILAGGFGTRITEESFLKPKPMIEIGEKPILWHIMKIYSHHGITDFVICCGYKGYMVKEYFANYFLHMSDVTFDMQSNEMQVHQKYSEPWKVTLVDTGIDTMTGGRLKRVAEYIGNETFCFTYGDGLADIDIRKLIKFHNRQKPLATVTGIQTLGRFGALDLKNERVVKFKEKPDDVWVSGGFFVLEPQVIDLIKNDQTMWEKEPLEHLAKTKQLAVYTHSGFWACMDTLRDKNHLETLWQSGKAPWKIWE
ncbi:MAG: glucose-1-phosphate cytidylyltransferase [Planctomycetes bacterium]|nr:glucose-1-phosphate cytidylyltransferase [Planctomycetota bacterium]MBU2458227.1 glucose-1-phosphate cytidylyltransferase [Planctomycetota bacterium]